MDDGQANSPAWKTTPHAAKIKSLLLRGRTAEADSLVKQANMEAAQAAATGCKPAPGGPGEPLGADSPAGGKPRTLKI